MGNTQKGPLTVKQQMRKEVRMSLLSGLPGIICYAGVFSHENYAPCTTSSAEYQWGFAHWIFTIVTTGIGVLLFPLLISRSYDSEQMDPSGPNFWKRILIFMRLTMLLGSFAFLFGISYAYSKGEDCPHLDSLLLSYIIIFPIIFVVIFIYKVYLGIKKKREEKNRTQENKHQKVEA